jgi:glutathione synthase/RimK-type ligase-like ATP-grasp enzyme
LEIAQSATATTRFNDFDLLIDRCRDRTSAGHFMAVASDLGMPVIGGGIASSGNRLDIAQALNRAGVPRPVTFLASSEEAGMAALQSVGYPATLFSLSPSKAPQPVFDEDIAEALLEHRHTLLAPAARTMLVQSGSPASTEIATVVVIGGNAVATAAAGRENLRDAAVQRLAEQAAAALDASLIGVQITEIDDAFVVWDIDPVPDFRGMVATGESSVGEAIAQLAAQQHRHDIREEVASGIALSV